MTVGAFLQGLRFRLYSLGTLLTVLVFAGLSFLQAAQLAANEPAPWLGLVERVGIYAWMLRVAVLAIALLRVPVDRCERPNQAWRFRIKP